MKLSTFTINALKNFSYYNHGIVIKKDNVVNGKTEIRIKSPTDSMQASVVVDEVFDNDICLYNLQQFLSIVEMVEEPDLKFEDAKVSIIGQNFKTKITYAHENEIIHEYNQSPKLRGEIIDFEMSHDDLTKILKFADILQLPHIKFEIDNGNIVVSATDRNNPDSKSSQVEIGKLKKGQDESFPALFFDRSVFKLMKGDYSIEACSAGAMQFTNKDNPVSYFIIALAD